jgi:hypothetical protein
MTTKTREREESPGQVATPRLSNGTRPEDAEASPADPPAAPAAESAQPRRFARFKTAVKRVDESTPKKIVGLVLLVAGAVTLAASKYHQAFDGPACATHPATFQGVPATNPTITPRQVNAVLRSYETAYGQHNVDGIKDVLSKNACRYPASGAGPQTKSAALDEYSQQFKKQETDPAHPHSTVRYTLDRAKPVLGAGGRAEATVTTSYRISGGKDLMGHGRVQFHIFESSGKLQIDQIVLR